MAAALPPAQVSPEYLYLAHFPIRLPSVGRGCPPPPGKPVSLQGGNMKKRPECPPEGCTDPGPGLPAGSGILMQQEPAGHKGSGAECPGPDNTGGGVL